MVVDSQFSGTSSAVREKILRPPLFISRGRGGSCRYRFKVIRNWVKKRLKHEISKQPNRPWGRGNGNHQQNERVVEC